MMNAELTASATAETRQLQPTHSFRSSQLSELAGVTLNKIKKNKKEVEVDVQKLHNRIKMLQFEEEKALKKIEETRKKAKQILEVKLANEKKKRIQQSSHTPNRNSITLQSFQNSLHLFEQPVREDKR